MLSEAMRSLILAEQDRQAGRFIVAADVPAYLAKLDEHAEVLADSAEGRCRGLVAFYCNDLTSRLAYISLVVVDPRDRGLGIGQALVGAVLSLARQRGFTACRLEVGHDNGPALALYRALGFAPVEERDRTHLLEALLSMTAFSWTKLGRIFDPATAPGDGWMHEFAQAPATLVFDQFVRVYFSCRPKPDASGQYVSRAAYVDLDRADLARPVGLAAQPVMPLGGLGAFDQFGTYPMSVIRRGDEILGYYGGWTRCVSVPFDVAIGLATSRDGGVTFEKAGPGPVLARDLDEPFVISGPKIRYFHGRWYLFYIAGSKWLANDGRPEPVYRIRMAWSDDGVRWQRGHRDLIDTVLEADECQASPDVCFANGRFHMFFCYRYSLGYRGGERGYRIGYASSTDLVTWTRDDRRAGLDVSDSGWDSEMVSYPHVFELDGTTWMMYLGNQVGRHGFGLARLNGSLT